MEASAILPGLPLPCQRHLFDIPPEVAYLNCAYMSPLLRASVEAGRQDLGRKLRPWEIRTEDFFSQSESYRYTAAQFFGATADDIAIVPAASYGIETAARNLPVAAGQRILVLDEQFPANLYPWRRLAAEKAAVTETVPLPADGDWTSAVLERLSPATAIAALPQVQWTTGGMLDLERIGQACRQHGTALVLDLTQSLGVLPFHAAQVQPDFAVAANYKWLLGPYTVGTLYAAPKWQQGRPLEEGWITRANARDFSRLIDYTDGYAAGARRFDMGERSNFALLGTAICGMRQLLDWGVERVANSCAALTMPLAEQAAGLGLGPWPAQYRAPHYLCLRGLASEGETPWPAALADQLARENIHVSLRGAAMRITPHVYNTPEEIERLARLLRANRG